MLPNEEFALACLRYYAEQGLIVDKINGEFAHCPLPRGMGETGYYLLHEHHQQQGLLQTRDVGRVCFLIGDAKQWLKTCSYWPDNYFDLWDIYDEFAIEHCRSNMRNFLAKNPDHQSKAGAVGGVIGGKKQAELGIGMFSFTKEQKTEVTRKAGKVGGKKGGTVTGSQVWESLIDGFRSNAAGVVRHNSHNGWDPNARVQIS